MKIFVESILFAAFACLWHDPATAAGKFFCCNDATGKQTCGDILPQACYGRAYREVGENGMIVRHIEAPLTPEQRAQLAAEEAQHRALEEQRKEQQRKDDALLATYSAENDIELMREASLADARKAISNAEGRISEFRARRRKFEAEAAAYQGKGNPPPEIQKGLDDADQEIQLQEEVIAARKNEVAIIREKYDRDLQRYRDIKRQQEQSSARPSSAPTSTAPAPAGAVR
ncbi:MAG: hypothetical protein LBJ76_03105 [Candidatus Accumulibacter sp.]|nr:hypothetical protein [Accumulibacter sp.]